MSGKNTHNDRNGFKAWVSQLNCVSAPSPLGFNLGLIAFRRRGARGSAKLHDFETVSKLYGQLLRRLSPVCQRHGPFLAVIAIGRIDKLVKCVVCRKDALGLGDFADLTVVALYGIGGVGDLTDGGSILKIAAQQLPFVSPRLDDNGIKFTPLLLQMVEFRFRFFLCVSGIDQLEVP